MVSLPVGTTVRPGWRAGGGLGCSPCLFGSEGQVQSLAAGGRPQPHVVLPHNAKALSVT